jgi:hypothetical protein
MPNRRDVVAEQLSTLADDLENLWHAATRDPKKEARRERAWAIVSGALGVVATMAARKLVAKLWPILTGERPPSGAGRGAPPRSPESARPPEESRPSAETPTAV